MCRASREPTWISHVRVRLVSVGESGRALLSGSSACSMRSLMAGFSCVRGRGNASERRREPRMEEGAYAAAPKAKTASTMVTKIRIARINAIGLDLDPNDLTNHEVSNGLQRDANHQHGVSNRIVKQRLDE